MTQKSKKHSGKHSTYLTKRILISSAKSGVRKASEDTMRVMGYVIVAQDGWIVKKFADGVIERIQPITPAEILDIRLD
ncbi:MAG TPA: hypothetical protein VMV20_02505 [Chitinophagaceae bacterium]|nr:hypothetical protein [Chitinophagaceae bacterium]